MTASTRRQRVSEFESITIRRAGEADLPELDRLGGLDSTRLPGDDFLIAEVDGEARAAVAFAPGRCSQPPFTPLPIWPTCCTYVRNASGTRAEAGGRRWASCAGSPRPPPFACPGRPPAGRARPLRQVAEGPQARRRIAA